MHNKDGYHSGKDHHSAAVVVMLLCCCCSYTMSTMGGHFTLDTNITISWSCICCPYLQAQAVFRHKFAQKFGTKNGPVLDTNH